MKYIGVVILGLAATACSSIEKIVGNEAIVDMKGVNPAAYQADLAECRDYAEQVDIATKTASRAATGAVSGTLSGVSEGAGNVAW